VHCKKKLNPKCVFLFQHPSEKPTVDVWYDNMPLVRNRVGRIMSEISKEFTLSQVYANHSLRATTVDVIDAANIAVLSIFSNFNLKTDSFKLQFIVVSLVVLLKNVNFKISLMLLQNKVKEQ
jgi:hypothetical protein